MSLVRARQRSLTAITPHNANKRFIIPKRQRELQFAGDTFIALPDASIIENGGEQTIGWTARLDEWSDVRSVWATNDGLQLFQLRLDTVAFQWDRTGAGPSNIFGGQVTQGVQYVITQQRVIAGSNVETIVDKLGTSLNGKPTAPVWVGAWAIGETLSGPVGRALIVMIRDFRIFNDAGVLIHHWPINDNVEDGGTILDVVGGQDGILTLGAGGWR